MQCPFCYNKYNTFSAKGLHGHLTGFHKLHSDYASELVKYQAVKTAKEWEQEQKEVKA